MLVLTIVLIRYIYSGHSEQNTNGLADTVREDKSRQRAGEVKVARDMSADVSTFRGSSIGKF